MVWTICSTWKICTYIFSVHLQLGFLFCQQVDFLLFTLQILNGLLLRVIKDVWAWTAHVSLNVCLIPICLPYSYFGKIWFVCLLNHENVRSHLQFDLIDEMFLSVFSSAGSKSSEASNRKTKLTQRAVRALCVKLFSHRRLLVFQTKSIIWDMLSKQ